MYLDFYLSCFSNKSNNKKTTTTFFVLHIGKVDIIVHFLSYFFQPKTFVMSTQQNCLKETVLLSIQNICLN